MPRLDLMAKAAPDRDYQLDEIMIVPAHPQAAFVQTLTRNPKRVLLPYQCPARLPSMTRTHFHRWTSCFHWDGDGSLSGIKATD
jgi:hypothetical protein